MLILDVKIGKKIIVGAGKDQVTVMLKDVEFYPDGTFKQASLGFDSAHHIPIDRETTREKKLKNIEGAMNPK